MDELAAAVVARVRQSRARTIAVDGPDAAGKTTFADALAHALGGAARLGTDAHLRPDRERETPEGYYASFDDAATRRAVEAAPRPLVVDGVFLQRPALRDLWDLTVYLHVEPAETLRRALDRDVGVVAATPDEVERRYVTRYLPGQTLYRAEVDRAARADVLVDNTDPARPVILR